jgi:HemY protein
LRTWEFTLGPVQAVIAAVLLLLLVWLVIRIAGFLVAVLRFLNGDETAISRWFDRNRERKGFEALADGLMALASGEARVAMSKAAKAERYLKRPELTNLITAQAAEMAGDRKTAETVYKRLLADERTRFVGVRGIMKQKIAEGDTETALKLAEKAFALKPRHEETQDVLLRLQAEQHDWKGARKTLSTKLKYGALPRPVHKRRDAVLALGEAKDIVDDNKSIEAREAAIEANRLSPDLVPAAAMAARAYVARDQRRYATRVLKKAWGASPHPDLATAFAEIEPDETPRDRVKRFEALTRQNPDTCRDPAPPGRTQCRLRGFRGGEGKALGDLPDTMPNARVLALLAAIERGEGATDARVRALLTRALTRHAGRNGSATTATTSLATGSRSVRTAVPSTR